MKTKNAIFAPAAFLATALLCWSCEMVGLGPRLDLEAPRLVLTQPPFGSTVPEDFVLAGTVTDNVETTLLTVRVDGVNREWRNNLGVWQTRETAPETPWVSHDGATWVPNGTTVSWTLPVSLTGAPSGELVISVDSFDEVGNRDAKSVQRHVVNYVNDAPVVTLQEPTLEPDGVSTDRNKVPQALADMTDDTRLNPAFIGKLYNGSVPLGFEITGGDFSLGGELTFFLAGPPTGADLNSEELKWGDIWYENTILNPARMGSLTIDGDVIKKSGLLPATGRTPLRIIGKVKDSQGKDDVYKSFGWFMWWPEADTPWVQFPVGTDPGAASYTNLYDDGESTAYAYDDDGVASLTWEIQKWDKGTQALVGSVVDGDTIIFGQGQSEWTFTMPSAQGNPGALGDYRIRAIVTDKNGEQETYDAYVTVKKRPSVTYEFLTRISSYTTDGYYQAGDVIEIRLDFDVSIIIENTPKLELNIANASSTTRYASYTSGSTTKTLKFTYTVQDGDYTPGTSLLDVTGFDTSGGSFKYMDPYYGDEVNINSEIAVPADPNDLKAQSSIRVIRGKPALDSASINDGGQLTVEFKWPENSHTWALSKGSGNLTLTVRDSDYRIPAVITEARYQQLGVASYTDSSGNAYYEQTINGAFADGSTDTDPKYVLRFTRDTAGFNNLLPTGEDRDLWSGLRGKEKITLSVYASQISLSGDTMTVNLGGLLPVKGVAYDLVIPEGFLKDTLVGVDTAAVTGTPFYPGVEKPFFRIEKVDEGYNTSKKQATQPVIAQVKLDCRTPGAEIYYTDPNNAASYTTDPVENYLLAHYSGRLAPQPQPATIPAMNSTVAVPPPAWRDAPHPTALPAPHTPVKPPASDPASRTKQYTAAFTIGSANYALGGMAYRLTAKAFATQNMVEHSSEPSYEIAYRSVLVFNNVEVQGAGFEYHTDLSHADNDFPAPYNSGNNIRIWIMGGDSTSGSVTTPGFPLSWTNPANGSDHAKIRLMTPVGTTTPVGSDTGGYTNFGGHTNTNGNSYLDTTLTNTNIPDLYSVNGKYVWYWVTWKLGNAAYVQFQRRALTTPNSNANFTTGSLLTSNLKQGWNDKKDYYPVFPGETRVVNPVTPYWYRDGGSYQFYKILGQRDTATKWHPL